MDAEKNAKSQWALLRKQRIAERFSGRLSWRRCFWTRPFGHIWQEAGTSHEHRCAVCGKPTDKFGGSYGGTPRFEVNNQHIRAMD